MHSSENRFLTSYQILQEVDFRRPTSLENASVSQDLNLNSQALKAKVREAGWMVSPCDNRSCHSDRGQRALAKC